MLHFLDFEVTKYDWLVTIANPITQTSVTIVNDPAKLRDYYERFKDEIFLGYNIREYDQWIFKAILAGFNPYDVNEHIITKGLKGYQFSNTLRSFPLIIFDLLQLNTSLKLLEGMQGHNIYESEIDFRIDRPLTKAELKEMIKYNVNDVQEAMDLFPQLRSGFDSRVELIKEFKLPLSDMSKTNSQVIATILGAVRCEFTDEFNLNFPSYLDRIKKYRHIVEWFKGFKTDKEFSDDERKNIYTQKLDTVIAGVNHTFAWGGLHGAILKYYGTGYYLHIDVNSYYPSLMISHDYFSRAIPVDGKERFKMVKAENIRLKAFPEFKKKRQVYKLICNSTYGCFKDKYNSLYDPLMANNICVTGQLALLLLIEMLEPYVELIQSNTDGLIVKLPDLETYDTVDDICYQWEQLTGVKLAFDPIITKIYQKDVNNYLFIDEFGDVESKGTYVKELSALDYDLPIVNKALKEYMVHGTPPEETINGCDELIQFQKIVKLSGKYEAVIHNGKTYKHKCYRVFASTSDSDGMIYKCRDGKSDKFANTPEKCFLDNGDIQGVKVPDKLDRQYYVNLAYERLRQFGGV